MVSIDLAGHTARACCYYIHRFRTSLFFFITLLLYSFHPILLSSHPPPPIPLPPTSSLALCSSLTLSLPPECDSNRPKRVEVPCSYIMETCNNVYWRACQIATPGNVWSRPGQSISPGLVDQTGALENSATTRFLRLLVLNGVGSSEVIVTCE